MRQAERTGQLVIYYLHTQLPIIALRQTFNHPRRLKELPSAAAPRQTCGTLSLDAEVVKALEQIVSRNDPDDRKKCITMQVRPHLLYKPNLCHGNSMPDETARYYLFDRVVNVREGYSVPLGLRGTVTG